MRRGSQACRHAGRGRRQHGRPDEERGAIAVITGVVMSLVLVGIAAIVVDLGMQRSVRRDMQALADVVALDLARLLDGRTRNGIRTGEGDRPSLVDALHASVANNDTTTLGDGRDCHAVGYAADAAATSAVGTSCVYAYLVELNPDGTYPTVSGGRPQNVGNDTPPDAVVVVAHSTVDFALGLASSGSATRDAVATSSDPGLCFGVGTKALALDTTQSALSPLLELLLGSGFGVDLDAISYGGVVDLQRAEVPLLGLLAELEVGSPDALATTTVSLGELSVAMADLLRAGGDTAHAEVLEAIAVSVADLDLTLGTILDVASGGETDGLTAEVNVLSLLTAAVVAANGENAVTVDLAVPGLTEASVRIIEPPQIVCSEPGVTGATAHSAQIRIDLGLTLPDNLTLGVAGAQVQLSLEVAHGTATLETLTCTPEEATFTLTSGVVQLLPPPVGSDGQLTASVSTDPIVDLLGPIVGGTVGLILTTLGVDELDIAAQLAAGLVANTETPTVVWPEPPAEPGVVTSPEDGNAGTLNLWLPPDAVTITSGGIVGALGALLDDVLEVLVGGIVTPLVDNTLDPLLTTVVNAVTDFLGVKLGVAELDVHSRPSCNAVQLVG